MGHETTTIYPILTGIECGDLQKIKGVRARGTVRLFIEDRLLAEETGEIQFTEDGISGICVMNLTMHITAEKGASVRECPAALSSGTGSGAGFLRKRAAAQEKLVRDFVPCSFSNSLIGGHKGVETSGARCEGLEKCTVHGRRDPSG